MIQIPDDLARCLEEVAAAQRKSVEQVALDSLRSLLDKSSPAAVLQMVRKLPPPRRPGIRAPSTSGRRSDLIIKCGQFAFVGRPILAAAAF
jgi:hypothetical protein